MRIAPTRILTPKIIETDLRKTIAAEVRPPFTILKFVSRLKEWYISRLKQKSIRVKTIERTARVNGTGPDMWLYERDKQVRTDSLLWRVGSWGIRSWCPENHTFRHTCVQRGHIQVEDRTADQETEEECPIDWALNNMLKSNFVTLIKVIKDQLD